MSLFFKPKSVDIDVFIATSKVSFVYICVNKGSKTGLYKVKQVKKYLLWTTFPPTLAVIYAQLRLLFSLLRPGEGYFYANFICSQSKVVGYFA